METKGGGEACFVLFEADFWWIFFKSIYNIYGSYIYNHLTMADDMFNMFCY